MPSDLTLLVRKLRAAADLLEDLTGALGGRRRANENGKTAALIRHAITGTRRKRSKLAGKKYNGTHWMQDPKNRPRVQALARKGRIANGARG